MESSAIRVGFDLRLLETFVVVARELNYRRAAELLYVSQPAVSQQIKKLEQQLRFALFERSTAGVKLTADGATLYVATQQALGTLDAAVRSLRSAQELESRRIKVGYLTTWARAEIPRLMTAIERQLPDLTMTLESFILDDLLTAIRGQELDLAIFHLPDVIEIDTSDLTLTHVGTTARFVAVPVGHRFSARRTVALTELANETWIASTGLYAENFAALCRLNGFTPNVTVTAANAETMLGLVRAGLGVTVVPNVPVGWKDLAFVPIADEELEVVVARHHTNTSALARQITDIIVSTFDA
ncbi:LysR family transcriptional regulator [Jiangella endophytica]|uniref:LysR family transcriptional regulator n=1 Tax=Jiangella endophytica TaxID=1623398 RepID=UPI000E34BDC5|nr:LysR family transcriptional regulator [Jiangella endophytica]